MTDLDIQKFLKLIKDPLKFANLLKSPDDPTQYFIPRDYQKEVLSSDSKKIALRFGRQTGKTVSLVAYMTQFAMVSPYKSIVVVAPQETHLQNLFNVFERMVLQSEYLKPFIVENHVRRNQSPRVPFTNHSTILGFVAGKLGTSVRGQRGDLLILDECLSGDTVVYTESGPKDIKDIRIGEKILSITTQEDIQNTDRFGLNLEIVDNHIDQAYKNNDSSLKPIDRKLHDLKILSKIEPVHFTTVQDSKYVGYRDLYLFRTETGRYIKATGNHPIPTRDGKYIPIGNATEIGIVPQTDLIYQNQTLKEIRAAIYGALRTGRFPNDIDQFEDMIELIGLETPEAFGRIKEVTSKGKKYNQAIFDRYPPINEVPDWVFSKKEYAAAFIGGYIGCCEEIVDDNLYLKRALEWFPELVVLKGNLQLNQLEYFFDNIKYRFNNFDNKRVFNIIEYIHSKSKQELREWLKERWHSNFLFEKIVQKVYIGSSKVYDLKTENGLFVANKAIVHNCDYLTEPAWGSILPIMNNQNTVLLISSTPTGRRGHFWKIFTNPDSGFETHHIPSWLSPTWVSYEDVKKNNLPLSDSSEHLFRNNLAPDEYIHEIAAEFGELNQGVFNIERLNEAYLNIREQDLMKHFPPSITVMGIDWNGRGIGTGIVILRKITTDTQLENTYIGTDGKQFTIKKEMSNGFVLIHSEMLKGRLGEHQEDSLKRIIYLRKKYHVNGIYADEGYGNTNIELLSKAGKKLEDPVLYYILGISQNSNFKFYDPSTGNEKPKMAKALSVFLLAQLINNGLFNLSYQHDDLNPNSYIYTNKDIQKTNVIGYQLREYFIKDYSSNGQPIYSKNNDHFIAALGFAILGYSLDFDPKFQGVGMEIYTGGDTFNIYLESRMEASNVLLNLANIKNQGLEGLPLITHNSPGSKPIDIYQHKIPNINRTSKFNDRSTNRNKNSNFRNISRRHI